MREEGGLCAAATELPLAPGVASFPCILVLLSGASGHDHPGPGARPAPSEGLGQQRACPTPPLGPPGLWPLAVVSSSSQPFESPADQFPELKDQGQGQK